MLTSLDLTSNQSFATTIQSNKVASTLPSLGLFSTEAIAWKAVKAFPTSNQSKSLATLTFTLDSNKILTFVNTYSVPDLLAYLGGVWFFLVQLLRLLVSPVVDQLRLRSLLQQLYLVKTDKIKFSPKLTGKGKRVADQLAILKTDNPDFKDVHTIQFGGFQLVKGILGRLLCCPRYPMTMLLKQGQEQIAKELDLIKIVKQLRMLRYRLRQLPTY